MDNRCAYAAFAVLAFITSILLVLLPCSDYYPDDYVEICPKKAEDNADLCVKNPNSCCCFQIRLPFLPPIPLLDRHACQHTSCSGKYWFVVAICGICAFFALTIPAPIKSK